MSVKKVDESLAPFSQEKNGYEKFTREEVARAILEAKGLVTHAARALECSPATVHNYIARYPELKETIAQARDKQLDYAESRLFDLMATGELGAIIFYLKTQGKARGYIERSERVNISFDIQLVQRLEEAANKAGLQPGQVIEAVIEQITQNAHLLGSGDHKEAVDTGDTASEKRSGN